MICLGIDTSNYTTSVALYDEKNCFEEKQLLPVKPGERGLRQSDALFHHTKALPYLLENLFKKCAVKPDRVGFSSRPRNAPGSYMPCFLAGESAARAVGAAFSLPVYEFSHQEGHIMAALYSSGNLKLCKKEFIAFHISGGTTEMLLVKPGTDTLFETQILGKTLDLNFGQAIDRIGVKMGFGFPCGKKIEQLALKSDKQFNTHPVIKGFDCCVSGLENKCLEMLSQNNSCEDVSKYCLSFIYQTIFAMTQKAVNAYAGLDIIYAGGVMSNKFLKEKLSSDFKCSFALPEFSRDNACGIAVAAGMK